MMLGKKHNSVTWRNSLLRAAWRGHPMECHRELGSPRTGSATTGFSWKRVVLLEVGKETPYNLLKCMCLQAPTIKEG